MARVPRSSLHFSVDVSAARPWEHVFVSGSTPSLGLWDPSKAVQLSPDPQNKSVFGISFIIHCLMLLWFEDDHFLIARHNKTEAFWSKTNSCLAFSLNWKIFLTLLFTTVRNMMLQTFINLCTDTSLHLGSFFSDLHPGVQKIIGSAPPHRRIQLRIDCHWVKQLPKSFYKALLLLFSEKAFIDILLCQSVLKCTQFGLAISC